MNDYVWTPAGTDITARWRRMGWVPPSELPSYQQKWSAFRELPLRHLEELERRAQKIVLDNIISMTGHRK